MGALCAVGLLGCASDSCGGSSDGRGLLDKCGRAPVTLDGGFNDGEDGEDGEDADTE